MAPILKFGDQYLFTPQIESIRWLDADTVEVRTMYHCYVFNGTLATALRTYLNSVAQNIG